MKDSLNLNPKVLEYGSKLGEIVDFAIRDDTGMITNVIEKGKEFFCSDEGTLSGRCQ